MFIFGVVGPLLAAWHKVVYFACGYVRACVCVLRLFETIIPAVIARSRGLWAQPELNIPLIAIMNGKQGYYLFLLSVCVCVCVGVHVPSLI